MPATIRAAVTARSDPPLASRTTNLRPPRPRSSATRTAIPSGISHAALPRLRAARGPHPARRWPRHCRSTALLLRHGPSSVLLAPPPRRPTLPEAALVRWPRHPFGFCWEDLQPDRAMLAHGLTRPRSMG